MERFQGEQSFTLAPAELHEHLSDARFLVTCIPDVQNIRDSSPERATLTVHPGFSFVRSSLEVSLERAEFQPPSWVVWRVLSKGIGTSSDMKAMLQIDPDETGSRVRWLIQVTSLGGLLKLVPTGLIRGAAQKVIADAWTAMASRLASSQQGKSSE